MTSETESSIAVELYGISDVVELGDAVIGVPEPTGGETSIDPADFEHRFARGDSWTGITLLLAKCDLESGLISLFSEEHEAALHIGLSGVEVGSPTHRGPLGRMPKWLVLARNGPIFWETPHRDPLFEARLISYTAGLGDFLKAWKSYSDAERRALHDLHNELGIVRFGRMRESSFGPAMRRVTIGLNMHESDSSTFLTKLARLVSEGRSIDLELSSRRPSGSGSNGSEDELIWFEPVERANGRVNTVNTAQGDIILDVRGEARPVGDGWVYLSVRGDLEQIKRRQDALRRLQADESGLPSLRSLLAGTGRTVDARPKPLRKVVASLGRDSDLTQRQQDAVRIALTTPDVALIQGPPGTGKTKVITAIEEALAQLEGPNRSTHLVLLTSTQNDAVDQVAARTRIFGLPPYRDNKRAIDPIADWRRERLFTVHRVLDEDTRHKTGTELAETYRRLKQTTATSDELKRALSRLAELATDQELISEVRSEVDEIRSQLLKPSLRLKLEQRLRALRVSEESFADDGAERLADVERLLDRSGLPPVWRDRFQDHIGLITAKTPNAWRMSADLRDDMLDLLAAETDERPLPVPKKILDLFARAIDAAKQEIEMRPGATISLGAAMERYIEDIEQRPKQADEAIRGYTVVHAATCQRSSQFLRDVGRGGGSGGFENAIVDEAGRVSPLDLVIPLVQARQRVILVGDHRQLPAVYDESIARGLAQAELLDQSLFERLYRQLQLVGDRTGVQRAVTLDQQFRMHPRLGSFVSRVFYEPYGEAVQSPLPEETFTHDFPGFEGRTAAWVDVPHARGRATRSERKSWSRRCEAEVVSGIVRDFVSACPDRSVGVVTFYGDQRDLIMELLLGDLTEVDDEGSFAVRDDYRAYTDSDGTVRERLRIGTVDAFQGKEFDAVILSTVRSEAAASDRSPGAVFGFLTVENRFCVALSRQRRLLVVVGDRAMADLPQAEKIRGLRELRSFCEEEEVPVG